MTLFTLPLEIQKDIISKTTIVDWAFCYRVNTDFRSLIRQCLPLNKLPENRIISFNKKSDKTYARNFSFVGKSDLCNDNRVSNWPRRIKGNGFTDKCIIEEFQIDQRTIKDIIKYMPLDDLVKLIALKKRKLMFDCFIAHLICQYKPLEDLLFLEDKFGFIDWAIRNNCHTFLLHNADNINIFSNGIICFKLFDETFDIFNNYVEAELSDNACSTNLFNLLLHKKKIGKDFLKDIIRYYDISYRNKVLEYYKLEKDILIKDETGFVISSAELGIWFIENGFILDKKHLEDLVIDEDFDSEEDIQRFYTLVVNSDFAPIKELIGFYIYAPKEHWLKNIKYAMSKELYKEHKLYITELRSRAKITERVMNND